jgi:hypothetical protein
LRVATWSTQPPRCGPAKMGEGKDGRHESEELALVGPLLLGEG